MRVLHQDQIDLLRLAARRLTGHDRRVFLAEVTLRVCDENARQAEEIFGWGRETVRKGLEELRTGTAIVDNSAARGRTRSEDRQPQLAADIRELVEPKTQADPELKSTRRDANLSAAERTLRDILNRMNHRLKRIEKGRPLKKTNDTDAVFENIQTMKAAARADPNGVKLTRKEMKPWEARLQRSPQLPRYDSNRSQVRTASCCTNGCRGSRQDFRSLLGRHKATPEQPKLLTSSATVNGYRRHHHQTGGKVNPAPRLTGA